MGSFIWGVLRFAFTVGAIAAVGVALLRYFFVDVAVVGHNSMAPTLLMGDEVLVWRGAEASMGAVMVCPDPRSPETHTIGRVIGKPGFTIETERGQLIINKQTVPQNFDASLTFTDPISNRSAKVIPATERLANVEHQFFIREGREIRLRPVTVKRGIYLLSDYRNMHGYDSRSFGEIDPSTCLGRVFLRFKPSESPQSAALGNSWFDRIK